VYFIKDKVSRLNYHVPLSGPTVTLVPLKLAAAAGLVNPSASAEAIAKDAMILGLFIQNSLRWVVMLLKLTQ
jgi:hypothetical protein